MLSNPILENYKKTKVAIRYFLLGREYFNAVEALEFASTYHTGTRKDGITPEFSHQLSIVSYIRTLPIPATDLEDIIAAAMLHDVVEDYDVTIDEIQRQFGSRVATLVSLMTNNVYGARLSKAIYYANLATDPLGAILKGSDRIHNIQSMTGVFSKEKQREYIAEVRDHILPMIKTVRRHYPKYEAACENIKHVLQSQIELIEAALYGDASEKR